MLDSRDDRLVSFRRCRSELCCDSVGLDSISSRVGGGGASDSGRGSPYTFYKNRHETHNRSVSSPVTDEFLFFFLREVRWNVCVSFPDVCTAEPRVHRPTAERVCCIFFLLFFIRCPGSFTNLIKMQRCWPFEWDSQIFFTW